MTTKKRDDIFDTEWPWYSLDFGKKMVKINSFFEVEKAVLLAWASKKKTNKVGLLKYFFGAPILPGKQKQA